MVAATAAAVGPAALPRLPAGRGLPAVGVLVLDDLGQLVHLARVDRGARFDDGDVETQEESSAGWQVAELTRDDFRRLAQHFASAVAAERAPDAGEQQPHVVVDLGGRADRRSRVADAVLLADGDRRRDAVDAVDVRLLHPLEELARVGGQRLDVPTLALRRKSCRRRGRTSRNR